MEIKKGRDSTPPMQLQIEIPLWLTIDIQNKKIPIQEITSALKGIEASILGKVLEEIDSVLISSMHRKDTTKTITINTAEKRERS
ncbi:hypothetical protein [Archaeoglobus sp.]|uniref:Uncharacterized protein n=3 Tax=Archaeoglobus fulgidus TaxID=2234 RepID=A0A075WGQ3_ARCFL|nr:hypothetical protein [Archaeoglobus sp.]AIG99176.1 hypothetical protein AFULGI_00024590 [Archaeoglobus fulgidus DSM 8774]KUJ93334.1 MAG: hypothetical protein XD40_1471 [Archaeoglobus fulgidus]KUK07349.1 MAG: hypothetical protein XD48_0436 [Archaeoglobus fulgidus]MDI3498676.1 hypothetical protein [Archaeoglobus sp.]